MLCSFYSEYPFLGHQSPFAKGKCLSTWLMKLIDIFTSQKGIKVIQTLQISRDIFPQCHCETFLDLQSLCSCGIHVWRN